ncbi:MAG: hypothetical protein JWQ02_3367 [Capsulimonas sp.]|nr:hypothetical protein [Capsulimonas sp.]
MDYMQTLGDYGLHPEQFGFAQAQDELNTVHAHLTACFDDILKKSVRSTITLTPTVSAASMEMTVSYLLRFLSFELPKADITCWNYLDYMEAVSDLEHRSKDWRLSPEDLPQRIQYWAWDRDGILDDETIQNLKLPKNSIDCGMIHIPSHHFLTPLLKTAAPYATPEMMRRMITPGVISIALARRTAADYPAALAASQRGDQEALKDFLTVFTMFVPAVIDDPVFPYAAKYVAASRYLKTHGGR